MNLTPNFATWELAVGAGIGAGVIAITGWAPVTVLLGAAVIAIVSAFRDKNWPVAVGVVLALWAVNAAWQPILPEQVTPAALRDSANAIGGEVAN